MGVLLVTQGLARADEGSKPRPRATVKAVLEHKERDLRWMLLPMHAEASRDDSDPLAFLSNDAGTIRWTPTKTGKFFGVAAIFKF